MIRALFAILLCFEAVSLSAKCPSQITVIAHRGNSSESPENTLTSFEESLALNIDYIEFDVHLSRDEVPVVIHDITTLRTGDTLDSKAVMELTVDELKKVDVGKWFGSRFVGETIPTLEEVLALPLGEKGLMIEIKEGSATPALLVEKIAEVVADYNRTKEGNPILVGSISPLILAELKKQLPEQPLIAIIDNPKWLYRYFSYNPKIIALKSTIATEKLVKHLISRNIIPWVYTVDNPNMMRRLLDMGVQGIITNSPRTLISLKEEYAKKCQNLIDTEQLINDPEIIRK